MFWQPTKKLTLPSVEDALPGRDIRMDVPREHFVSGHPLEAPWPSDMETALFGMGCFWGAERKFWQLDGVLDRRRLFSRIHQESNVSRGVLGDDWP